MELVDPSVPRMTEEGLALVLGTRTYGAEGPERLHKVSRMAPPPEMAALGETLLKQSRLLALGPDAAAEAIYDAYGADLALMARYRDAFKATVEAAVRARADAREGEAQAFLARMTQAIAEVVHAPSLDLGAEALKLAPAELGLRLQQQFRDDVESLKQSVAIWLHVLAEAEYVSVVEWLNPKALRYHFFRIEESRRTLARNRTVAPGAGGARTITTTTEDEVTLFSERRVHTVVNAAVHALDGYDRRVPRRIARLIDETPAEIRPYLTIVDGTVSQEEVLRKVASKRVETTTRSVYIPDPALTLFNTWAITGWGGSTPEKARSTYRGHPISTADKWLAAEVALTLALAIVGRITDGVRGAIVLGLVAGILALFHQISLRLPPRR